MPACQTGIGNLLSLSTDQIAIVVARTRKLKSLPSNPFVVVVSPLKGLISDQLESYQTLKFKAVKMKLKLFDHDDKLKEFIVCFRHALWALHNGSVTKPQSMLNTAIFDPWQRSLFSRQQTAGKEPLLAGKFLWFGKVKFLNPWSSIYSVREWCQRSPTHPTFSISCKLTMKLCWRTYRCTEQF